MDLQELKQKWNILDERLSTSDVYNQPMLTEIIRRKNKTSYKEIRNGGLINLFTALFFAAVLVPIMHVKGICHDTSFYILEGVCLLCVLMAVCRLWIISRFNVDHRALFGVFDAGLFAWFGTGTHRFADVLHRPRYSYGNKLRMDGMDKTQDNDAED